ncbi:hypothetical protein [Pseudomonas sp. ML2-2023-3]|uniref:hypothetical protein n=1 Tax=Pseudomonas sp. ML2-2023-3 TaxID=3122375 RepID=UPI0030CA9465
MKKVLVHITSDALVTRRQLRVPRGALNSHSTSQGKSAKQVIELISTASLGWT